jgi:hypothetical protein
MTDDGVSIDPVAAKRLFELPVRKSGAVDVRLPDTVKATVDTQRQSILDDMAARQSEWFDDEIDKLDNWAEDRRAGLKADLKELDEEIKALKREVRQTGIRLGFLRYVALIRSLGYELVFPDLFSPTTKSPLGNRYYKLFKPVLTTAGITEEGLGSHALRHAFGAALKRKHVREELRADLLGHAGKSETSERYCEPTEIAAMYKLVCKMPTVTKHLVAHPINLPAWLADKKPPPFSHPTRARHSR